MSTQVAQQQGADGLEELPDELRQLLELKRQQDMDRVDALGKEVAKLRDEAVSAKTASGIERIWKEDEEYYLGIDDLNRSTNAFTKGMNPDAGLTSATKTDEENQCTAFFNITRQFVDAASARMGDILLPAGDWNWKLKLVPTPDLDQIKDSTQQVVDQNGQPVPSPNQDGSPYTLGQFAQETLADANIRLDKAERRIRGWLTDCRYHAEARKVIEDAAKLGTGILRGAYPAKRKTRIVKNGALVIAEQIFPTSKHVSPWNFFPDPSCGDNIQNGKYVFELDHITARQLRDLKDMPGYIAANVEKVIEEGADKKNVDKDTGAIMPGISTKDSDRFKIWYFFGLIDITELAAFPKNGLPSKADSADTENNGDGVAQAESDGGSDASADYPDDLCPAIVVMVNDTPIKAFLNPLDNGEFPYDVMPWQRVSDTPWGIGVSRQGRTSQEMLNASARALMDNMGLSAAPQIIVRKSAVRPADGEWKLVAGKVWIATDEANDRPVADCFASVKIDSCQQELAAIIDMAYKMIEDATGVTFLLQGQNGGAPDTLGGMILLHQNASALLRRIARMFDECITEPHILRYYDWLLIHGEDDEKGDYIVEAIGSTALVERDIQATQAAQILSYSINPAYGLSPANSMQELLRAWRFDPSKFQLSDQEKQQQAQSQPVDARVQVAQVNAQSRKDVATIEASTKQQEIQQHTDRDNAYLQSVSERDQMTYQSTIQELNLRKELALLEYANQHQMKLEDVKAALANTAMKLNVEKELASLDAATKQPVMRPPVQIPGRAENGHAFEQV